MILNEHCKDSEACSSSAQSSDKHVLGFFWLQEALSAPCLLVNYFVTVGPCRFGHFVDHRPPTAWRTGRQALKQLQKKSACIPLSPFLGLQTGEKQMGGK